MRASGFAAAFTTTGAAVRSPGADVYRLSRVRVPAISPERLMRNIRFACDE